MLPRLPKAPLMKEDQARGEGEETVPAPRPASSVSIPSEATVTPRQRGAEAFWNMPVTLLVEFSPTALGSQMLPWKPWKEQGLPGSSPADGTWMPGCFL